MPRIRRAMEQGVPVAAIWARTKGGGALTVIGLDSGRAGGETAMGLIRRGSEGGRLAVSGNRGAPGADARLKGCRTIWPPTASRR